METLLEQLKRGGGFTMTPQGSLLETGFGYQVGIEALGRLDLDTITNAEFIWVVESMLKKINNGQYLGAWVDKGYIYLDKSVHVIDYRLAMLKAKEHNQISVYDWCHKDCLKV